MTDDIPHGEKMISFKLRFWTTDLNNPKMAWNKGAITVITNRSRGIRHVKGSHVFFHNIEEIPKAVKEIFKKNGITLVERDKNTKRTVIVNL